MVRAKFRCDAINTIQQLNYEYSEVILRPVSQGSEEDKAFWKATPGGELKMNVVNPEAAKQFTPGQSYYIDFTPAD